MKFKKEVILGFFGIAVIVTSILGYKFLKGENVFSDSLTIYTLTPNAKQLLKSSPLYAKGFQVGIVKDIRFDPAYPDHVLIELRIDQAISLPKNGSS